MYGAGRRPGRLPARGGLAWRAALLLAFVGALARGDAVVDRVGIEADPAPHGAGRALPLRLADPRPPDHPLAARPPHDRRRDSSASRSGWPAAVMQGVTRNPLADPGILGVEAGASLFVVVGDLPLRHRRAARLRVVRVRRRRGRVGRRLRARLAGPRRRHAGQAGPGRRRDHGIRRRRSRRRSCCSTSARSTSSASGPSARSPVATATIARQVAPFIVVGAVLALVSGPDAQRAGARRRRRPARSASASALVACARRRRGRAARRRRDRGRRPDRVRRPHRAARRPAPSPGPTTAGSCRTRWCWRRSCCSAPTSSAGSIAPARRGPGRHRHGASSARRSSSLLVRRRKLAEL